MDKTSPARKTSKTENSKVSLIEEKALLAARSRKIEALIRRVQALLHPIDVPTLSNIEEIPTAANYFTEVYARAVEVIGNSDKAMRWFGDPVPALNYATPVSLLNTTDGRDAVLDVLGRMEYGVF